MSFPVKRPIRIFQRSKFLWSADKKWNKCRLRSLEECDRGKSLGRIDGCSCSSRYYRFLSTRQRRRRCACIRDFIQPCEGPSVAGGAAGRMEHLPVVRALLQTPPPCTILHRGPQRIRTTHVADIDWVTTCTIYFTFYAL